MISGIFTARKTALSALVALAALALFCSISVPAYAQVAGATLSGTVTDASGALIPNAAVSIKNTATGVTRDVITDSAGFYSVPNLLPGTYDVAISASGFSTAVNSNISLAVGAQQVLNQTMQVGQTTQTVQVTGAAPTVQLASSTLSNEVNSRTVRELPLNGRDWTQLATLEPGITAIRAQTAVGGTAGRGNRGFGNQLSDAGHRPYENNYRVNGISINDYSNGSPGSALGVQLGVDGIQEFSVLTTDYSAEYGRTSGGVVNAITKSGTNDFHGDAYWFLRDEGFDARNFFDKNLAPFHRNQFGASAGGPIRKDKTFVFGDYEGIRQDLGLTFHDIVPSSAARSGSLCSTPNGTCTPTTITVDPKVVPYLALYPLPNSGLTPGGNGDTGIFNTQGAEIGSENYVTARIDHTISDKDNLDGSFFYDRNPFSQPDPLLNSITGAFTLRQMYSLEENHIFSPTFTNTVRIGFSRTQGILGNPVRALVPAANDSSLGAVPGLGLNAPILSIPGLNPSSNAGALGSQAFYRHNQNSYQVYDDAFITRGAHSIKTGFAFERIQFNSLPRVRPDGTFTFGSLGNFLQDIPNSVIVNNVLFAKEYAARQSVFGGYVQDDWRARPNLTLNLGLRYEPVTLPVDANNNFGVIQNLYNGPQVKVQHLWQRNQTLRDFDPRVGFSWDPFHKGKTAVRGGFGIFDVLPLPWEYVFNGVSSYPYSEQSSAGSLPPGSFPTGAFGLIGFNLNNLQQMYVDQFPHRNYSMNWNLNVQQAITPNWTAMVGYVGSHTLHQPFTQDDGNMVLPTLTSAGYLWPFPVNSGTRLNTNAGVIRPLFWNDDAHYNGLEAKITKQMSHGFQAEASYTLGKCIDEGSGAQLADPFQNSVPVLLAFADQGKRGPCDFNVAQSFVVNYVWDVPSPKFSSAVGRQVLGGWELGGIFTATTGTPFTVLIGGDPLGQNNASPDDFPDRLTGPGCGNSTNTGDANSYLKLSCFGLPAAPASFASVCQPFPAATVANTCANLFGNAGRNQLTGPGTADLDFSLFKNIPITRVSESFNLQLRFEFFNILNRANFQAPIDNSTLFTQSGAPVGGAGSIDATTTTSRQIQFAAKVVW